jgi:hypothetical protein
MSALLYLLTAGITGLGLFTIDIFHNPQSVRFNFVFRNYIKLESLCFDLSSLPLWIIVIGFGGMKAA